VDWIGIDDEGCVGVFRTRPGALVPRRATPRPDAFALDAIGAARLLARGRSLPEAPRPSSGERALVVVDPMRTPSTYREGPRASDVDAHATVVAEGPPRVLATPPLDFALAARLEHDATVVRAIGERALHAWVAREPDAGVYRFAPSRLAVDRYDRITTPADPIRVHELPIPLQHAIRDVRFRARFYDTDAIELFDELPPSACTVVRDTGVREPPRDAQKRLGVALVVAVLAHVIVALVLR
jgi:hypothetical protein